MSVLSDTEMLHRMRRVGFSNGALVDIPPDAAWSGQFADVNGAWVKGIAADDPNRLEVHPFSEFTKIEGHPSYGLGSYGIDLRLGPRYKYLDKHELARRGIAYVRPSMKDLPWITVELTRDNPVMIVPPRSALLAEVMEKIRVPRDCHGFIFTKSTWARLFIDLNTTPAEPEWVGVLTIEVTNQSDVPVGIEYGEGICQLVFDTANEPTRFPLRTSYADRENPTYQDQKGVLEARA